MASLKGISIRIYNTQFTLQMFNYYSTILKCKLKFHSQSTISRLLIEEQNLIIKSNGFQVDEDLLNPNQEKKDCNKLEYKYTLLIPPRNFYSKEDALWLEKLQRTTLKNLSNYNCTAEFLSDKMGVSRRHLLRRMKVLLEITPTKYLKESRLQQAYIFLKNQTYDSVKTVCDKVGLRDVKYFSQQFKKRFDCLPSSYLT